MVHYLFLGIQGHCDPVPVTGVVQPFFFHRKPSSPNVRANTLAFIIAGHSCSVSPLLPHQFWCPFSFLLCFSAPFERTP